VVMLCLRLGSVWGMECVGGDGGEEGKKTFLILGFVSIGLV
jgi:hypothetical protein